MTAPKPPPVVTQLEKIIRERYFIGREAGTGRPFAAALDRPSVLLWLGGPRGLETWLVRDWKSLYPGSPVPGTTAVSDAIRWAAAEALTARQAASHLRIASDKRGDTWLDLGSDAGAAMRLSLGGWQVVDSRQVPVLFRRTEISGALPVPAEWGSMEEARRLFNIPDPSAWALFCACRIASLMPGVIHPVEVFTGPAGSGKTMVCRMTQAWADPRPAFEMSMPQPEKRADWPVIAQGAYQLLIDNVSGIAPWWSDLLCRGVSGDAMVTRQLYTDAGLHVAAYRNVVLLNGITLGSLRGDLADRSVMHELEYPAGGYADERDLELAWRAAHPEALAWLAEQAVMVMREMAWGQPLAEGDRMVTFMRVVAAVDRLWGTRAMEAWKQGRADVLESVISGDIVAQAVTAGLREPFSGTARELLELLRSRGTLADLERGRTWTPQILGDRLMRAEPALAAAGWQVRRSRDSSAKRNRIIEIAPPGYELIGYSNGHGIAHHEGW